MTMCYHQHRIDPGLGPRAIIGPARTASNRGEISASADIQSIKVRRRQKPSSISP
jgi:hypothetical protein